MRRIVGVGLVLLFVIGVWRWSHGGDERAVDEPGTPARRGDAVTAERPRRTGDASVAMISGRVTGDGMGLAGATVALVAWRGVVPSAPLLAMTDASGAWTASDVPPGYYALAASAIGFLPEARLLVAVRGGEPASGLDFALVHGGVTVSGRVTDIGGGPVAGAQIAAKLDDSGTAVAVTARDGTYELTVAAGFAVLRASRDDYALVERQLDIVANPAPVDFVLAPGASLRGQVIANDTGMPVAGALVEGTGAVQYADAEGRFAIAHLWPGVVRISAWARDYTTIDPTEVEIAVGEHLEDVRVLVDPGFAIRGRVVRAQEPSVGIAGVTFFARAVHSGRGSSMVFSVAPSAADGAFEMIGAQPGTYLLESSGGDAVPPVGVKVTVRDRSVEDVVIPLERGVAISGRVEPAGVAVVDCGPTDRADATGFEWTANARATADASGAFTLHAVPAGTLTVEAKTAAGQLGATPVIVGAAGLRGVVIHLAAGSSISGRVVDTHGTPIGGASISATTEGPDAGTPFTTKATRSARDGAFRIVGMPAGGASVWATDARLDSYFQDLDPRDPIVHLTLAAGTEHANLTLTLPARDGMISGRVLDGNDLGVADVMVTASLGRAQEPVVLTGADGAFRIRDLRDVAYTLVADSPRTRMHGETADVHVGSSVTIRAASFGQITGRVRAGLAVVEQYDVECANIRRHVSSADGVFIIGRIVPGHYTCAVTAVAGTAFSAIDVPAGPVRTELSVTPWATVTGTLIDPRSGRPASGVIVSYSSELGGFETSVLDADAPVTDANGAFVMKRVAAGRGYLVFDVGPELRFVGGHPFEVAAGTPLELGAIAITLPLANP